MTEAEFEMEKMDDRRAEALRYREWLLSEILAMAPGFTREALGRKSTRALERIFDNI